MVAAIKDFENDMTHSHLPIGIKFIMFLNRIKFRIFVLVTLGTLGTYWGNLLGMAGDRITRFGKKYKKRWIYKYNRPALTYPTALETRYEPAKLSRASTDKLSQLFLKIDREMEENGFSRQLVADCLIKMELMAEKKELTKFLDDSGHNYIRSKKLNAMSLKDYLVIIEQKFLKDE